MDRSKKQHHSFTPLLPAGSDSPHEKGGAARSETVADPGFAPPLPSLSLRPIQQPAGRLPQLKAARSFSIGAFGVRS